MEKLAEGMTFGDLRVGQWRESTLRAPNKSLWEKTANGVRIGLDHVHRCIDRYNGALGIRFGVHRSAKEMRIGVTRGGIILDGTWWDSSGYSTKNARIERGVNSWPRWFGGDSPPMGRV